MADRDEDTRKVKDYLEYVNRDYTDEKPEDKPVCTTVREAVGLHVADTVKAMCNLKTANDTQEDLNAKILERNSPSVGLDEFLAEEYQKEESKEYLVEGATLTCTESSEYSYNLLDKKLNEIFNWDTEFFVPGVEKKDDKVYGELIVTSNKGADIGNKKNATIFDCTEENIPCFGNCRRLPDNEAEWEKLRKYHNAGGDEMRKHGICKHLRELESEWENYIDTRTSGQNICSIL